MNIHEAFALGNFLCEWGEFSYEDILEAMENEDDEKFEHILADVTVWEPFEKYGMSFVVEQIENMYKSTMRLFIEKPAREKTDD